MCLVTVSDEDPPLCNDLVSVTSLVALFICVVPTFFSSAVKGRKLISYFDLENKGSFFHSATAACC